MTDPTKKSIVISKSFLSGGDNSGSSNLQSKKSKKNTRVLSEEIIKPNKLKKMLLDKINAKRKADQTSSLDLVTNKKIDTLDISKETKLFSSEFKKSLDFLDSYIGQKRNDKSKPKTLKKQLPITSLNNDILKSIHNTNNNNNNNNNINNNNNYVTNTHTPSLYPSNITNQSIQTQTYTSQSINPAQVMQTTVPIYNQPRPPPFFQKIQLQIPSKPVQNVPQGVVPNTVPKISLAIGKPVNDSLVYTELPPELQNFKPPVCNIYSPSISPVHASTDALPPLDPYTNFVVDKPRDVTDSREMAKFENDNSELIDADIYTGTIDDLEISKTSLLPSSTTFSPVKLSDDAPYGCLKNGNKPTFRAYNKTIKNNIRFSDNENSSSNTDNCSNRQAKLKQLQNKHNKKIHSKPNDNKKLKYENNDNDNDNDKDDHSVDSDENSKKHNLRKTKIKRHLRKTITKKFKLGKQSGNFVGVLIKNNDTRKNIQKEHGLLKTKQLADVKKYLVEKNLIKIGSTAPSGIIRNIYEASMLTGEVENIGKGVGLHNFLEDKGKW
jgi:hypothetical protein